MSKSVMSERMKNALLVFMGLLMAALFAVNLMLALDSSRVRESLGISNAGGQAAMGEGSVVMPEKIGVIGPSGLYLAGGEELSEAFSAVKPIIYEALGSVKKISRTTRDEFIESLGDQGIYFSFTFPVPFYMLQYWWTGEMGLSSDQSASVMALTVGDGAELYFYDGAADAFYMAETAAGVDRLMSLCGEYKTSNAFFASSADGYQMLSPWEPVTDDTRHPVFTASRADFSQEGAISQELLSSFSLNPFLAKVYKTTDGDIVYVEGYTSIEFSREGVISYSVTNGQGVSFDLPDGASGKEKTAMTAAAAARLLESVYSAASCRCELSLARIESRGSDEMTIYFERMEGGAFISEEDGCTAVMSVKGGRVSEMRLHVSSYTAEDSVMLLPYRLAVSLVGGENRGFSVRYTHRDGRLTPGLYVTGGGAESAVE